MKRYQIYIFDLDGTLTDTIVPWLDIFREGLQLHNITPPDDQTLSKHTHRWEQMLELGLPESKLDDFIKFAHQAAHERLPKSALHAGAYEMLEALKNHGKQIGIFSTMDRAMFEPVIKYRNLTPLADALVAGNDVPRRKPEPDGILKVLTDLGISKKDYDQVVYIGDKDTDIQAAHNAGVDGVLYYPAAHQLFYDLEELKVHKPEAIITDWQELVASLE